MSEQTCGCRIERRKCGELDCNCRYAKECLQCYDDGLHSYIIKCALCQAAPQTQAENGRLRQEVARLREVLESVQEHLGCEEHSWRKCPTGQAVENVLTATQPREETKHE